MESSEKRSAIFTGVGFEDMFESPQEEDESMANSATIVACVRVDTT